MIEQTLKTLGTDVGRIADALEKLVELNERMLGSMSSVPAAVEPEALKQPAAKGGKGKAAAAPEPADPEPEPEPVDEKEEGESDGPVVTLDDVKAIFLKASQADKKGANETFEAFKSETGTNKVSDLNDAQRAKLHSRFEAVIAAAAAV